MNPVWIVQEGKYVLGEIEGVYSSLDIALVETKARKTAGLHWHLSDKRGNSYVLTGRSSETPTEFCELNITEWPVTR